ncbi:MAG: hypothetical protein WAT39_13380 [Planctomycetota bacterium]
MTLPPGTQLAHYVILGPLGAGWGPTLARDGQSIAFTNGRGGTGYTVVTPRLDGAPISTLGDGDARGLSPDGRWAVGELLSSPTIMLYPTGAGAPRRLDGAPIERFGGMHWARDGKSLILAGSEPSRPMRMYRLSIDGGRPEPITAQGIHGLLSPTADEFLAADAAAVWRVHPLDGGPSRVASGLLPTDRVVAWSPGGDAVWVSNGRDVPLRLTRVELATGTRTEGPVVGPPQQAGVLSVSHPGTVLDPARGYAYGYRRQNSKLFLAR